jgi:hypothetical protein
MTLIYFHEWLAHFKIQKFWSIFTGGLTFLNSKKNFSKHLCFPEIDLFSRATYPFQILITMIYIGSFQKFSKTKFQNKNTF